MGRSSSRTAAVPFDLAAFQQLTPATVAAASGDRFPPRPLHVVRP